MAKVVCDYCGQEFDRIPAKIKNAKKHFCCLECKHKYFQPLEYFCDSCGRKILVERCKFKRSKQHFCSVHCARKGHKKLNNFKIINNEYIEVFLKYKNIEKTVLVDYSLLDFIKNNTLWLRKRGKSFYIGFYKENKIIYLHRYLTKCPSNLTVDHINGNPLDNRLQNLRICTNAQNAQNKLNVYNKSTGCRNVHFAKNGYVVEMTVEGKRYYLGRYKTLEEAKNIAIAKRKELMPFATL
jgi:hypothetical protein